MGVYSDEINHLIPVLLIGRWDENKEGDRKIIGLLEGESYETYSEKINGWS